MPPTNVPPPTIRGPAIDLPDLDAVAASGFLASGFLVVVGFLAAVVVGFGFSACLVTFTFAPPVDFTSTFLDSTFLGASFGFSACLVTFTFAPLVGLISTFLGASLVAVVVGFLAAVVVGFLVTFLVAVLNASSTLDLPKYFCAAFFNPALVAALSPVPANIVAMALIPNPPTPPIT